MPTDLRGFLFILGIFYVLPFVFSIILPAFLVPAIFKKIIGRKKKLPSIFIFAISIIVLAFLANLFWDFFIYNKIYYEWDRVSIPYSLFWHESPSTENPNWLAEGWTKGNLFTIWLLITIGIYLISLLFAYLKNRKHKEIKRYLAILSVSAVSLLGLTIVAQFTIFSVLSLIFMRPVNLDYKENNSSCILSDAAQPRILYRNDGIGESISDSDGSNMRPAFKKNLQLSPFGSADNFSPNDATIIISWGDGYWFHCLNSDGAFKISPPKFEKDIGHNLPRSFPSWAPDSKRLIMNNNGDLTLIDLNTKTTVAIKKLVAIKDNQIDILSKNSENKYYSSPYTVGDAFWSKSGLIYYTSFEADTVHLHQFNLDTNQDSIILSKDSPFYINQEVNGQKYLVLRESQWAHKYNQDKKTSVILLDLEKLQLTTDFNNLPPTIVPYLVFSPSGNYMAKSSTSFKTSPQLKAIDAMVFSLDGDEQFNITEIVRRSLEKQDIYPASNTVEVVNVIDFLNDSQILITMEYKGKFDVQIPRRINGILDLKSESFAILQNYPEEKFDNRQIKERLDPIGFVR